jgi:hypothetical protein
VGFESGPYRRLNEAQAAWILGSGHPRLAFNKTYWLRVFRLIGLACKVLGLLILVLSPELIYGPLFLGGSK